MTQLIKTYDFTHGNTSQLNRRIDFTTAGPAPGKIQAMIYKLDLNGTRGQLIATIPEDKIIVEMLSTTEAANKMAKDRIMNTQSKPIPDQLLSNFNTAKQINILNQLAPNSNNTSGKQIDPLGKSLTDHSIGSLKIYDPR